MRTGKDRVSAEGYNEPVQIAGVRVEPDDWLRGDSDGVVVVPAARVHGVLDAAEEIARVEDHIRGRTADGAPLGEIRAEVGYYQLQTRGSQ